MNPFRIRLLALAALAAVASVGFPAQAARAATVSMPTTTGPVSFDTARFASSIASGPSGPYGCFTAGTLDGCSSAVL